MLEHGISREGETVMKAIMSDDSRARAHTHTDTHHTQIEREREREREIWNGHEGFRDRSG
eukprot:COSAG03_NODE_3291_length_2099_cov_6.722500_2_plen_60_part_00